MYKGIIHTHTTKKKKREPASTDSSEPEKGRMAWLSLWFSRHHVRVCILDSCSVPQMHSYCLVQSPPIIVCSPLVLFFLGISLRLFFLSPFSLFSFTSSPLSPFNTRVTKEIQALSAHLSRVQASSLLLVFPSLLPFLFFPSLHVTSCMLSRRLQCIHAAVNLFTYVFFFLFAVQRTIIAVGKTTYTHIYMSQFSQSGSTQRNEHTLCCGSFFFFLVSFFFFLICFDFLLGRK